jgi:hypothetical protein
VITEDQARELLRNQASDYVVLPVTGDAVAARARSATRRRRLLTVAASGVAAAAVVVVGMTLAPNSPAAPDRGDPPIANPMPVAPDGYRLVGMNGLVVAVPEKWGTNDLACDGKTATADTVLFMGETMGGRGCFVPDQGHAWVRFSTTTSEWAQGYLPWSDGGEIDGARISVVPIEESPEGLWETSLMVADRDLIMSVRSGDRAVVETIRDSLAAVPAGYTTVPPQRLDHRGEPVTADITRAGLDATVVQEYKPGWSPGVLIRTEPSIGSIVSDGADVTVVVTGQNPAADGWPGVFVRDDPTSAINCVSQYPDALGANANAFDGTVVRVAVGAHPHGPSDPRFLVTLRVNETFAGEAADTVDMQTWDFMLPSDYESIIGTRILAAAGPSLEIKACGYTRAYDEKTANAWRDLFQN